ncbi:hypothetical protein QUC32_03580 [Novosphingobium resinovorum]|uniref:hypothetical protein n=1 Tax=Novosphingobium TaxID=165696 RepID=UPI001B3C8A6C|nr:MULTISPECIES: hypothetical protein [Novosphingobium]MBF7013899.1 hypothetical protein [Novosphingobium sp. HR1a]WJM26042.1 hypothetical protein QUC32_03580 [Novosphingobium resinovorum]
MTPKTHGKKKAVAQHLTMSIELVERIDKWRENAFGQPTRPEAIRRLIEKGLMDE